MTYSPPGRRTTREMAEVVTPSRRATSAIERPEAGAEVRAVRLVGDDSPPLDPAKDHVMGDVVMGDVGAETT